MNRLYRFSCFFMTPDASIVNFKTESFFGKMALFSFVFTDNDLLSGHMHFSQASDSGPAEPAHSLHLAGCGLERLSLRLFNKPRAQLRIPRR